MYSYRKLLFCLTLPLILPVVFGSTDGLPSSRDLLVQTTSGLVQGFLDLNTTNVPLKKWLGVPYAADTSGANRWRPPQPFEATPEKVLDASAYGPACMQGR